MPGSRAPLSVVLFERMRERGKKTERNELAVRRKSDAAGIISKQPGQPETVRAA